MLIRRSLASDSPAILTIVNDAARAYHGVIPADRWHEPYMSADELEREIAAGVVFWIAEDGGRPLGVMGIQDKGDVALVRHAYVDPSLQRSGVGTKLLRHVESLVDKPILIGTWATASWAIEFYRRNGFDVVSEKEKDRLLRRYWSIPVRQIETSVVLANQRWIKGLATALTMLLVVFGAACSTLAPSTPRLNASRSLFNGRDLSGWDIDVPAADSNVRLRSPFVVRNGMLVSLGEPRGHLISDSIYRNYRLEIEYRFPGKPGNAGVLVHASTPRALYGMFPKSIEVQMESGNAGDFWCIVEDIRVPDMVRRRGPRAEWGVTEGKARRILNLTDDSEKPVGQWNTMVIDVIDRSIIVWVNGDRVNEGSYATADRGRIALQSEGSEVEFRKILLTPLGEQ